MHSSNSVLIVEDDETLARMLQSSLVQSGYEVATAKTGGGALDRLTQQTFGVMLLDLGLPDIDGKQVIVDARSVSRAAIIVVSARDSEKEKITALDLGANDYVAKPFDTGELMARIRVAFRQSQACEVKDGSAAASNKGLQIDFQARRACIDGHSVRLSRKEAELLQILVDVKGAVVSHDQIINTIWGRNSGADYMNLRVLAWQVRRKIEPDTEAPRFLIAEAGEGYRLNLG
ncbi:MAG TPA: response regulator transcription factor [Sphingomicrobium sp.]